MFKTIPFENAFLAPCFTHAALVLCISCQHLWSISCVNRLVYHGQLASTYEGRVPPFSDVDHACTVTRVPLGVCALVTPWNHPLLIAVKKVSVALATGNCVVVKPPEVSPCSVLELGRILQEAGLPDGVRVCASMFIHLLITTVSHSVLTMGGAIFIFF